MKGILCKDKRTWAEIDLGAVRANYAALRRFLGCVKIMSVVKADAYGHGIRELVPTMDLLTDWYAVATVEEGLAIREAGSKRPILLLGNVPEGRMAEAARAGLTFTVGSLEYAKLLSEEVPDGAAFHLEIDTGMNRNGISWRSERGEEALTEIEEILALPGLTMTGAYTHFAAADSELPEDRAFTDLQFARFTEAVRAIRDKGYDVPICHCSATGGIFLHPDKRMDMVRTGMMIYGQCDTHAHAEMLGLRQALTWKSVLTEIRLVKADESVSYGRTWTAEQDSRIGIISCGYADGYLRNYQGRTSVLIRGRKCPVIGRICMDYMMADLTGLPEAARGDEVVLLGRQGGEEIHITGFIEAVDSVCGAVTSALSPRVLRVYIED